MGSPPPVIVSDEEKAMAAALNELQLKGEFSGRHFLDAFHILRNVRKSLRDKEHLFFFKKMLHARTNSSFNWWVKQTREKMNSEELPTLDRFLRKSDPQLARLRSVCKCLGGGVAFKICRQPLVIEYYNQLIYQNIIFKFLIIILFPNLLKYNFLIH